MRGGTGEHHPRMLTQPEPYDNTATYVLGQVGAWKRHGTVIHAESAREVAAWFQSPVPGGRSLAAFASTGRMEWDLIGDVWDQLRGASDTAHVWQLLALLAYLTAPARFVSESTS